MYYVTSPYFNGKIRFFDTKIEAIKFVNGRAIKIANAHNQPIDFVNENISIDWKNDMNIKSGGAYPSNALSNFAPHEFYLDNVKIKSMEGFLQSLKTKNPKMQEHICSLVGIGAKKKGASKNWQSSQTLYWQGNSYNRNSIEYTQLIERAFDALFENAKFRKALTATGNATLKHSMGRRKKQETVLTTQEFISNLNRLRDML